MKAALLALGLIALAFSNADAASLPSTTLGSIGVSWHPGWDDLDTELDQMKAAGVAQLRTDLQWNLVETTQGTYDFSNYSGLVSGCAARGIQLLWVLDYPSSLYGTDYTSSSWQQGYANFAAAAAANFKGQGDIYEIWNEPNLNSAMTASTYMAMLSKTSPAMRTADSTCTLIAPSLGWDASSGGLNVDSTYLKSCLRSGLLNLCDAVAIHPYRFPQYGPETVVSEYTSVKSLMTTYGHKTLPIVSSEWGYDSYQTSYVTGSTGAAAEQLQAAYLARTYLVNMSQGIPLTCWYDWRNDGTDPTNPEDNYGIMTADGVAKPAYNALHLLTASLKGETYSVKLSDGNSADWLLVFTGGGHTTLAAWTTGTADTAIVPGWGTYQLTSTPFYVNPTLLPGDANLDGTVNVQDLAILAANYRKQVTGGWLQADFNNDGVVDVEDLAILAANYRHSLASDVVPGYDGLDAAAIELLSLDGVTVVPEPGALLLSATGLIGTLGYTWTKRGKVPVC